MSCGAVSAGPVLEEKISVLQGENRGSHETVVPGVGSAASSTQSTGPCSAVQRSLWWLSLSRDNFVQVLSVTYGDIFRCPNETKIKTSWYGERRSEKQQGSPVTHYTGRFNFL